ncbi:MAG: hypothetical protein O2923_08050 [Verrucomicrobia bacterium]|nr:hypothetical protein [Verrucomicrobiota bacterium]MDA1087327.1 hypothetical protein [Verrucomicrobiota bacterium]
MKQLKWIMLGAAILVGGCQTVEPRSVARTPVIRKPIQRVIGKPIQTVISAGAGRKIEIFDEAGKQLEELPQKKKGSVSVYNKDQNGQDNYKFDENGMIEKHLQSYGADYAPGKWKEVQ